jgi:hypothetical protein
MHPVWHIFVDRKVRKWSGIFKCHLDLQGLLFLHMAGRKLPMGGKKSKMG